VKKVEQDDVLRKMDIGVRRGVARALEELRRAGRSIVVWKDGKIVWIPPAPSVSRGFRAPRSFEARPGGEEAVVIGQRGDD
jgi:hypothetical protein